ncbi:MAG TPA: DUF4442 domain-containing protein [Ferruginibacter sp.]|nr:DUF4442 domain-containing protein [Ferruginibacter sp.]HQV44229.1 DUF4442 domain-containing protein [Ferruginibacter sp.]HQW62662.1 DUF4442 domain-containing protein [Ferruginibacter sp.]HQY18003.1 DUF4442 domain-containing protein [Ferruginibacter sp.]
MNEKFLRLTIHPFKLLIFLFKNLPSAFFSGVRVQYVDGDKCVVTVPYKWFSRNPFRSTYFACLSMAAEMSTGVLAMGHSYGQNPPLSMLVLKVEGTFSKKATGITTFTCDEGKRIAMAIKETVSSGKSVSVTVRAVGKNKIDELVADFYLTWSFKVKAHKNK